MPTKIPKLPQIPSGYTPWIRVAVRRAPASACIWPDDIVAVYPALDAGSVWTLLSGRCMDRGMPAELRGRALYRSRRTTDQPDHVAAGLGTQYTSGGLILALLAREDRTSCISILADVCDDLGITPERLTAYKQWVAAGGYTQKHTLEDVPPPLQ